ncbi:MAG: DUF2232 domain-containing protein [Candidatus Eisenbacteria bacterium]|uniref:DUF2232 domain-containing protein n=1 Tax=Eiseniibacteriota bacterium TaxID=2212470 RepID=A0A538U693_UNCEI|nr:MAG: DUF2232 domain-containing protein [Candidatus Eisenbacteria bacterium]
MLRTWLLVLALAMGTASFPLPWGSLWLAVPGAVALGLLLCWRWGPWGVLAPVGLMTAVLVVAGPFAAWAWWIPVAALTGCWMGLREEGGGPEAGQKAWMMLPLLLLAAGLPWTVTYPDLVSGLDRLMRSTEPSMVDTARRLGYEGERLRSFQRYLQQNAELSGPLLRVLLPSALFVWMTLLVGAGRVVAAQVADRIHWPDLSRARFSEWRLPDGAIWLFLAGMGLLLAGLKPWAPTAATLLIVPGLGYCAQGIAVVESLLLLRGVPPSIISLTLLFVFIMAFPVFILTTVCVGLSDVWLDYRRLEVVPDRDVS